MPDPDRPDDAPRSRRKYVPVPGVIDLDSVESDARNALWGADEAPTPDAEDEPPPGGEGSPDVEDVPEAPPPRAAPETSERTAAPASPSALGEPAADPPDVAEPPARPPDPPTAAAAPPSTPVPSTAPPASGPAPPASSPPAPGDGPAAPAPAPRLRPPEAVVETAKAATKDTGRELVALVAEYGKRHLPHGEPREPTPDTGPPRLVGRLGQVLPVLQVIPWLLGAVFAFSFFWDFDGLGVDVFGLFIPLDGMLRILSVSGLIGFLTNWLAITMLFQPREKRAIIPQGLIPAQRERVIYRLSQAISQELINADIIKQRIQESGVIGRYRDLGLGVVRGVVEDPAFRADLKALAQRYARETLGSESLRRELAQIAVDKVEEQAGQGLGGVALRLYRTFAEDDFQRRVDNALSELPQAVTPLLDRIDAALDTVPARVEARGDEIEEAATRAVLSFVEGFDIQAMIQEKARGFDEAQLENLLKSTSNEQLNYIKYLGGILGVFGGLVIWRAEMLVVFVAVGLALWALDEVLVRARRD